ncbi:hypothetical protein DPMN_162386 [Dreissena polymorpha]|uniref:Uncharacterized protein n=1 Tax=Dreissena polymorpha TaxID=45954 RepID=A0A9D4ITM7_DREPO|nr:hypothetical protein DPMN_162386 [Dreissena polymorpha]
MDFFSIGRSHFHLNKLEVSTGPVADLSSIPAAHLTTIPATVTSTSTSWRNYNNYTHFHMDRKQVSRCPVSG